MNAYTGIVALITLMELSCLAAPPAGYRLVWGDEFDGATLDTNKWDYRTDSKMWSTQLPANVSVRDGKLILMVKKEEAGDKHYTGAGIISRRFFKYGYYEARLKTPPGAGWHTSFWMMQHDRTGGTGPKVAHQELDVIENDSVRSTGYSVNIHKWKGEHVSFGSKRINTPDLSAAFHVYGCEFTSTTVRYFLDDTLVQTVDVTKAARKNKDGTTQTWEFEHGDQNIWLTTIASSLGGTKAVDDSKLPAVAEFDWVRFYELALTKDLVK